MNSKPQIFGIKPKCATERVAHTCRLEDVSGEINASSKPFVQATLCEHQNTMAPSDYLNHRWNIINCTLGNKLLWNLSRNLYIFIQEKAFENVRKITSIVSRPKCVKQCQ